MHVTEINEVPVPSIVAATLSVLANCVVIKGVVVTAQAAEYAVPTKNTNIRRIKGANC